MTIPEAFPVEAFGQTPVNHPSLDEKKEPVTDLNVDCIPWLAEESPNFPAYSRAQRSIAAFLNGFTV
ncbi:MAG: hypothetical protein ACREE6_00200, partial [Limisphaerales bacterium]